MENLKSEWFLCDALEFIGWWKENVSAKSLFISCDSCFLFHQHFQKIISSSRNQTKKHLRMLPFRFQCNHAWLRNRLKSLCEPIIACLWIYITRERRERGKVNKRHWLISSIYHIDAVCSFDCLDSTSEFICLFNINANRGVYWKREKKKWKT